MMQQLVHHQHQIHCEQYQWFDSRWIEYFVIKLFNQLNCYKGACYFAAIELLLQLILKLITNRKHCPQAMNTWLIASHISQASWHRTKNEVNDVMTWVYRVQEKSFLVRAAFLALCSVLQPKPRTNEKIKHSFQCMRIYRGTNGRTMVSIFSTVKSEIR